MSDSKFDSVGLVRQIRDQIYEETKDMSSDELIAFFRSRAARVKESLGQLQPEGAEVSRGRA